MKKLLVAGILGMVMMVAAGTQKADAAVYRRPVVYRPYYAGYWHRPYYYPYVYAAPAPAPVYTYPTYPAYYGPGVSIGVPNVGIRIGR